MKICSKCKKEKDISSFSKDKGNIDGLRSSCKECKREGDKSYQVNNKTKVQQQRKNYRINNKTKIAQTQRKLYEKKKDYISAYNKKYHSSKKADRNVKNKERYSLDISYKLQCALRTRLNISVRRKYRTGSSVRDLGCTIDQFKDWLERQFEPNMSWDNYGRGVGKWSIDHEYPLNLVDLTNRNKVLPVIHYTNLQPMWNDKNTSKSNRLI